jgi:hypothetical protein
MISIRKNTEGQTISFSLKDENTNLALNLTSATVVANQYSFGANTFVTSNSCVIVTTDNTATTGMYYFILDIEYESGNYLYRTGESLEVYDEQENIVTPKDLINFIQIPMENAKSFDLIKQDLEFAESQLDLEVPILKETTDVERIKLKRYLIMIKASISYFMNMDEGNISPDRRMNKIKEWERMYNVLLETLGETLSSGTSGEEGSGLSRRLKSSKYEDDGSWLYGLDK